MRGQMCINGVQCVTLAHGFQDEKGEEGVVEHEYFGTQAVLQDLKKMRGWECGLVTLHQGHCIVRDPLSGRVCGLRQHPPAMATHNIQGRAAAAAPQPQLQTAV